MDASFHTARRLRSHIGCPRASYQSPGSESDLRTRMLAELPAAMRTYWERDRPIELRPVDLSRYFAREKREPVQYIWMRATGRLPDNDPPLHQCVLAYASDFSLLDTALIAHGKLMFDKDVQLASLDHALWFHRPFRADEWSFAHYFRLPTGRCLLPVTSSLAKEMLAASGAPGRTMRPGISRRPKSGIRLNFALL